jgi:hypothetical protein
LSDRALASDIFSLAPDHGGNSRIQTGDDIGKKIKISMAVFLEERSYLSTIMLAKTMNATVHRTAPAKM